MAYTLTASVVQLVRTLSIIRVVRDEFEFSLKWKYCNFPHHLWLLLCDLWFGADCNQEVRFSSTVKALNDDLLPTLTSTQVAETRSNNVDCPINDPDAILQIMFSGRHISIIWTIMGRSSLCYLMNGLNLMKGRRSGPKCKKVRYFVVVVEGQGGILP